MSVHKFQFSTRSAYGSCSCGNWSVFNRKREITEVEAKKDFTLHKENAREAEASRRAKKFEAERLVEVSE